MKRNVLNVFTGEFDVVDTQNIEEVLAVPTNEPDGIYVINITGRIASLAPATGQAVGSIQQYASAIGIPTNELILTGDLVTKQEIDKVAYAALYAVIGDFHGVSVNPANFVLPPIVGLLPKGGTALNYTINGGSDTLLASQLPQHRHSLFVNSDTADSDSGAGTYLSSQEGSGGASLMSSIPTNLEIANADSIGLTGSGLPHEHPYQNFIYTICFESVAYGGVSPTPNLQQVSDVGFNSTNRLEFNNVGYVTQDEIPTTENIQDAAFGILTDTATIDLTYNDALNTVAADVNANSITNILLTQMAANTVKVNNTNALANAVDLAMPQNTVLGRDNLTGNIEALPVQDIISGKGTLIAGQHTVVDTRISTTSFVTSIALSTTGIITSIPIKWTASNGSMLFDTGQITDTVVFGYTIYI